VAASSHLSWAPAGEDGGASGPAAMPVATVDPAGAGGVELTRATDVLDPGSGETGTRASRHDDHAGRVRQRKRDDSRASREETRRRLLVAGRPLVGDISVPRLAGVPAQMGALDGPVWTAAAFARRDLVSATRRPVAYRHVGPGRRFLRSVLVVQHRAYEIPTIAPSGDDLRAGDRLTPRLLARWMQQLVAGLLELRAGGPIAAASATSNSMLTCGTRPLGRPLRRSEARLTVAMRSSP